MTINPPRLYLIDASIYIFRAYFSLPAHWHSPCGYPVNAVFGYSRFLLDFLEQVQPGEVVAAFDESLGQSFRHQLFPDYKASRVLPDDMLAFQLAACKTMTKSLGITTVARQRYEADDIIASLAIRARAAGKSFTVLTRDKDLGQLLTGADEYWWNFSDQISLDGAGFAERFGVRPDQFADFLALVGDSVDDIPGVPGVGEKTAVALLRHFDNLDTLFDQLANVGDLSLRGARRIQQRLGEYEAQVRLARQLTGLATNVPKLPAPERCVWRVPDTASVARACERFGLGSALGRRVANSPCLRNA